AHVEVVRERNPDELVECRIVKLLPPFCIGEIVGFDDGEAIFLRRLDFRPHVVGPDGAPGRKKTGEQCCRRADAVLLDGQPQNSFSRLASRSLSTWKNFAQVLFSEKSRGLPITLPRPLGRKKWRSLEK